MKLSQIITLIATAATSLSLIGCASIVDGGRKSVSIKTQPIDAKATVYDAKGKEVAVAQTPAVFHLKRSSGYFSGTNYRIVLEKPGFKTTEVKVKSKLNGWYAGNVVFGGLIGILIVDPITGAMWTLSPKQTEVALGTEVAFKSGESGLFVMLRQDVPAGLEDSLMPVGTH